MQWLHCGCGHVAARSGRQARCCMRGPCELVEWWRTEAALRWRHLRSLAASRARLQHSSVPISIVYCAYDRTKAEWEAGGNRAVQLLSHEWFGTAQHERLRDTGIFIINWQAFYFVHCHCWSKTCYDQLLDAPQPDTGAVHGKLLHILQRQWNCQAIDQEVGQRTGEPLPSRASKCRLGLSARSWGHGYIPG